MSTFRFHALAIAIAASTLIMPPLAFAIESPDAASTDPQTPIRALDAIQVQGSLLGRSRPDDVQRYAGQVEDFLDTWLPRLGNDTRSYVTIAFGCTGGKHRSVYLAERLARHAREQGWPEVATFHREQD